MEAQIRHRPFPKIEPLEPRRLLSDGSLDTTFATTGLVKTDFAAGDDRARAVILQPDGKIIVLGKVIDPAISQSELGLVRYNTDGSLDTSFGTGGKIATALNGGFNPRCEVLEPDGSILVGGGITGQFAIAKFTSAGQLDTSFGTGGEVLMTVTGGQAIFGISFQRTDGKIVAGGDSAMIRLNSDGSPDPTFGTGGTITVGYGPIKSIAVTGDLHILFAGNDAGGGVIARINPDGTIDHTLFAFTDFSPDLQAGEFRALTLASDGTMIAAGHATNPALGKQDIVVARFHPDGTVDTGFGIHGVAVESISTAGNNDLANGVAVQPDRKTIVAGSAATGSGNSKFILVRFNNDGSPDGTFGTAGVVTTAGPVLTDGNNKARAVVIQPDGRIVAAGFGDGDFVVARYTGPFATLSPGGTLTAGGTYGDDTLNVSVVDTSAVAILNGQTFSFPIGAVTRIEMFAGSGNDVVSVGPGLPQAEMHGGLGGDTITGGDGADTIFGGRGNDSIQGDGGNDSVFAGRGNDTIQGGKGNDTITGADGNDQMFGGADDDTIFAADGFADVLDGGAGNDSAQFDVGVDSVVNIATVL